MGHGKGQIPGAMGRPRWRGHGQEIRRQHRDQTSLKNFPLPVEYKIPESISGTSQARGNSGIFLASTGLGDDGYELQVLDNYQNDTYVNGMAGSLYKQSIPLANACRKPGEWSVYDVAWTAPTFNDDGSLKTPAYA